MSLYEEWEKAHMKEWPYFYDFVAHRRKSETGYKGEFTPDNTTSKDLSQLKVSELKELAEKKGIETKGLLKADIVKALGGEADES